MSRTGSHDDTLRRSLNEMVELILRRVDEILDTVGASGEGLEPRQRATLDIGCCLVLGTLGLGLQLGGWSAWSVAVATAGYLVWVVAYSEATVQASLRQRRERDTRLA